MTVRVPEVLTTGGGPPGTRRARWQSRPHPQPEARTSFAPPSGDCLDTRTRPHSHNDLQNINPGKLTLCVDRIKFVRQNGYQSFLKPEGPCFFPFWPEILNLLLRDGNFTLYLGSNQLLWSHAYPNITDIIANGLSGGKPRSRTDAPEHTMLSLCGNVANSAKGRATDAS